MPTLHTALTPTSTYAATTSFANVTGYTTGTISITSGSAVLLIANVPWEWGADPSGQLQFFDGTSVVGQEVHNQAYLDSADEEGYCGTIMAIGTGYSGNVTFTVRAKETEASLDVREEINGSFIVIELLAAEFTLYETAALISTPTAGVSFADVTDMSLTLTPAVGDILLCLGGVPCTPGADLKSVLALGVGGTAGTEAQDIQGSDAASTDGMGGSFAHAVTGYSVETTFSLMWKELENAETATADDRYFQVLQLTGDSAFTHNAGMDDAIGSTKTYAEITSGTTGAKTLTTGHVYLMLAHHNTDFLDSNGDCSTYIQFFDGSLIGGEQNIGYIDSASSEDFSSGTAGWALAGDDASHTLKVYHRDRGTEAGTEQSETGVDAWFQVIDLAPVVAGGTQAPHPFSGPLQRMFGGPF